MTNFFVTDKIHLLKQATGYWSGNRINCNLSEDHVVLLQAVSSENIGDEIGNLQEHLATSQQFKAYFANWVGKNKNYLGAFNLEQIFLAQETSWSSLQKQLRAQKFSKERISRYCAQQWWQYYQDHPSKGIVLSRLQRLPVTLAPLAIDWTLLTDEIPEQFLEKITNLSQLTPRLDPKIYPDVSKLKSAERNRLFVARLPARDRSLIEWLLPGLSGNQNPNYYVHAARLAIQAAAAVLAWLRCRGFLVLPLHCNNIAPLLHDFSAWPRRLLNKKEAKPVIRAGLLDFIGSTTASHINDVPVNLLQIYNNDQFPSNFYHRLGEWLNHPAVQGKRQIFPIDQLQVANLARDNRIATWTPDWIRQNCNDDWYDFACIWWLHPAHDGHKRDVLRNFMEWAWERRSFSTPWEITPEELRNPHRPSYTGTYFHFLKNRDIADKSASWSNSATLYRVVRQYALLPDSPALIHGELHNPFSSLPNPFSRHRRKAHKTHRASIPSSLHELMIDVLLSPDDEGNPTFSWAEEILTQSSLDIVRVPDPDRSGNEIKLWCPSRATCLAMLLLTPIRGAQARWLDQGLMDVECYDFTEQTMKPNQHPLKDFRYANGKTHVQQYGRSSGILQFSSELLTREQCLSIFVNTNKTQLWDGSRLSGYQIPWPDGSELLASSDPGQREQGKWLARVYRAIEYQMNWMTRYDPEPWPVSFFHSHEDRARTTELKEVKESLPWFVPLFRDLSLKKMVSYTLRGKIHKAFCPVSKSKINHLYNLLAVETERRATKQYGRKIYLTTTDKTTGKPKCRFDIHSLRVTWVSRLFEMGIPVQVISEFIVGHATQLMTTLYLKIKPAHVREALIQAAAQGEMTQGFEALLQREQVNSDMADFLISAGSQNNIHEYLSEDFTAVVPVEGGICPMGGKGSKCAEGGTEPGSPVKGGCGNCRFFLTGPDFLLEQLRTCNWLMLKMRSLGKEQKRLYEQLDDIRWELHKLPADDFVKQHRLETRKHILSERISTYNDLLTPLILEWCNRHEMLLASSDLLQKKNDTSSQQLMLVGGHQLAIEDFSVVAQKTTEFGLIRGIIEQARITLRQGYTLPEEPGRMLREFMNIILAEQSPQNLLLGIPDEQYATQAASVLAGWLHDEFGDEIIQDCIDRRTPLPMTAVQNTKLQQFTKNIIDNYYGRQAPVSSLLPKSDPRRITK